MADGGRMADLPQVEKAFRNVAGSSDRKTCSSQSMATNQFVDHALATDDDAAAATIPDPELTRTDHQPIQPTHLTDGRFKNS